MSRKIQELTEKLSSDKHNAVSALEREKYELIRKHEAEKASMLAELKGSLQDNAAECFETIKQQALEEQRQKLTAEKQVALDNLKAELTAIEEVAVAQAKAEAAAAYRLEQIFQVCD